MSKVGGANGGNGSDKTSGGGRDFLHMSDKELNKVVSDKNSSAEDKKAAAEELLKREEAKAQKSQGDPNAIGGGGGGGGAEDMDPELKKLLEKLAKGEKLTPEEEAKLGQLMQSQGGGSGGSDPGV